MGYTSFVVRGPRVLRFDYNVLWLLLYSFGLHKFCGLFVLRLGYYTSFVVYTFSFGLYNFCDLCDSFGLHKFCGFYIIRLDCISSCGLSVICLGCTSFMVCTFRFGLHAQVLWSVGISFGQYNFCGLCVDFSFGLCKFCGLSSYSLGCTSFMVWTFRFWAVQVLWSVGSRLDSGAQFLRFVSSFGLYTFCGLPRYSFGLHKFLWFTRFVWACSLYKFLWFARYSLGLQKFCGLHVSFGLHKFCGLSALVWAVQVLWFVRSSIGIHKFCGCAFFEYSGFQCTSMSVEI